MAKAFTIELKGMGKVQAVFKKLPKTVQSGIRSEFIAVGQEWMNAAKADAPVDRGRLKGAISAKPSRMSLEIVAQSEQAPYMEFGTGKQFRAPAELGNYPAQFRGSGQSSVNPIEALTAWVKRKGLNAVTYSVKTRKKTYRNKTIAARSIAFAIYRKIKRDGLRPRPFLFTGKDGSNRMKYFSDKIRKGVAQVLKEVI